MLRPPEPIGERHDVAPFDCGKPALDSWLKERALANHRQGFSAVMVVGDDNRVVGYYALAPTSVDRAFMPRSLRGGQPPNPVPALLLGQLAVDKTWAARGVGAALLAHALRRSLAAAELIGGRAVVVRAIDDEAAAFWARRGFLPSRSDPRLLLRSLADIAAAIAEAR